MNHNGDPASDIAAVQRHFLDLFATSDFHGIAGCYTEDAQMLVANMNEICGRGAIQSVFKLTAVRGHTLEFGTHELDIHGATAVEIGGYIRRHSDGSIFDRGKYIVVWKRVAERWLIHRDMFSTSLPKTAVPTPA